MRQTLKRKCEEHKTKQVKLHEKTKLKRDIMEKGKIA
jgi:hypothetical protein